MGSKPNRPQRASKKENSNPRKTQQKGMGEERPQGRRPARELHLKDRKTSRGEMPRTWKERTPREKAVEQREKTPKPAREKGPRDWKKRPEKEKFADQKERSPRTTWKERAPRERSVEQRERSPKTAKQWTKKPQAEKFADPKEKSPRTWKERTPGKESVGQRERTPKTTRETGPKEWTKRPRTEKPSSPGQERPRTGTTKPKASGKRPQAKKMMPAEPTTVQRIQKIIAAAGITSRRKAEELIQEGRVRVNGKAITELGAKADPAVDRIEVDGRNISRRQEPLVYILLNKPKGYISALSDPAKRPVVTDLVKVKVRVYPVGRLDYDAEGVLLLTNDGDLSNKLIHPNFKVPKTYLVKVSDVPTEASIKKLEKGVHLEDGKTLPAKARFVKKTDENSWIELTVTEGRNRLVKRMCQAIGHPVLKLKRVEFAGIRLGGLPTGGYRLLTQAEVERLKNLDSAKDNEPKRKGP